MKLTDLFVERLLAAMIAQGYVSVRTHPTEPLAIYNYTAAAQYDRVWNDVTLTCRGLIVNHETGDVVARPLAKFFTWGQPECPLLDLNSIVHVADKQDGSLGILYPTSDGWAIATRGSFTSDQAVHATDLLRAKYADFTPLDGYTYLFEIIYPDNRIVVDYGDTDDLVLLGVVEVASGDFFPHDSGTRSMGMGWDGPTARSFGNMTFAEALAMEPRSGAEGIVVLRPMTGEMVKIKQEAYVRLHALVTQTSTTTVWERLASGATVDEFLDGVPDEFTAWVRKTAAELDAAKEAWLDEVHATYADLPKGVDRKTFAAAAVQSPHRGALFRMLDGKPVDDMAWKAIKPAYSRPFEQTEAVA